MRTRQRWIVVALTSVLAACGDHAIAPDRAVATVQITPSSADLLLQETTQLTVTLRDAAGRSIYARPVTWTTGDATVATVDLNGIAKGIGVGTTTLTATSEGIRSSIPVVVSAFGLRSVSAGGSHSCALDVHGRAYCWGVMYSALSSSAPAPVPGQLRFATLSAGLDFTCGVTTNGEAWCWGWNREGRFGSGTEGETAVAPVAVAGGHEFARVTTGFLHACGLTRTGAAYCWGAGNLLGNGGAGSLVPVAVSGGLAFKDLSAGREHTCGVTTAGTAYCWGINDRGQLGTGATTLLYTTPASVSGSLVFSSVSAGFAHTCGVITSGEVYCWGNNGLGQLGDGSGDLTYRISRTPVRVSGDLSFLQVTIGEDHSCGFTATGAAYCWGGGIDGQLGDGTTVSSGKFSPVPTPVTGGLAFTSIDAGWDHTCGMSDGVVVYCWGSNASSQLGTGTVSTAPRNEPVKVAGQP